MMMMAICVFALLRGLSIVQFSRVKMEIGSAENRAEACRAGLRSQALDRRPCNLNWRQGSTLLT